MCQGLSTVQGAFWSCFSTSALRRSLLLMAMSSTAHGWAAKSSMVDSSTLVRVTVCSMGPNDDLSFSTTSFRASLKCLRPDGTSSKLGSRLISWIQAEQADAEAKGSFRRAFSSFLSLDDRSMSSLVHAAAATKELRDVHQSSLCICNEAYQLLYTV